MSSDPTAAGDIVQRTRLAAYAWCEANGAALLVRIAPGYPEPGSWTLPGGGLDFGEDPAEGVLRELTEETGLAGRVDALLGIRSGILEPDATPSGHRLHVVGIVYRVTVTGGELRDERDGSTDHAEWIPFDRLDAMPLVEVVQSARGWTGR